MTDAAVVGGLLLKTTMVLPLVAAAALPRHLGALRLDCAPARMIDGAESQSLCPNTR